MANGEAWITPSSNSLVWRKASTIFLTIANVLAEGDQTVVIQPDAAQRDPDNFAILFFSLNRFSLKPAWNMAASHSNTISLSMVVMVQRSGVKTLLH